MLSILTVGASVIGAAVAQTCTGNEKYSQDIGAAGSTKFLVREGDPQGVVRTVSLCVNVPTSSGGCIDPRATVVVEHIDLNTPTTEFVDLYYGTNKFANCLGGQYNCNVFTTCIGDYDLSGVGLNSIAAGSNAQFEVKMGGSIDVLCTSAAGSGIAINAEVTITCNGWTPTCAGAQPGRSHEINNAAAITDNTQCGLGCSSVASIEECNLACLTTAGCDAYLYSPLEALECALFSSTTPVSRGASELMCEPCPGGLVRANADGKEVLDVLPKNNGNSYNWAEINDVNLVELLAINAGVSVVVSLAVVSSCIACYFMCNQKQKKYVGVDMVEEDSVLDA